jgi:hypothetical protein
LRFERDDSPSVNRSAQPEKVASFICTPINRDIRRTEFIDKRRDLASLVAISAFKAR